MAEGAAAAATPFTATTRAASAATYYNYSRRRSAASTTAACTSGLDPPPPSSPPLPPPTPTPQRCPAISPHSRVHLHSDRRPSAAGIDNPRTPTTASPPPPSALTSSSGPPPSVALPAVPLSPSRVSRRRAASLASLSAPGPRPASASVSASASASSLPFFLVSPLWRPSHQDPLPLPATYAPAGPAAGRSRRRSSSRDSREEEDAAPFGSASGPTLTARARIASASLASSLGATASTARMLGRSGGSGAGIAGAGTLTAPSSSSLGPGSGSQMTSQQTEASLAHQQITETVNKRISTLDYLRKAHGGRIYWFNTYLFDKPDLTRMSCFDPRRAARRATNYLLLGLSLPIAVDLNSGTPAELLRSLNALLSEFESFQQLHGDGTTSTGSGLGTSSLSRARLPQMFRRAAAASGRSRRAPSTDQNIFGGGDDPGGMQEDGGGSGGMGGGGMTGGAIAFAASETDLLPGEEYVHLLTPSLPFEPDFYETFATLCDVLVYCYQRLLSLIPTPKECTGPVAELFSKADVKIRKIIVQNAVKEFEESSRAQVKSEVASIAKAILGGLM